MFSVNRLRHLVVLVVATLALGGCAQHNAQSDPYGFLSGIWHGILFPYSLLANILSWCLSLFGVDFLSGVQIVGRPNTGFAYYLGFFFGVCAYGGADAASGNSSKSSDA